MNEMIRLKYFFKNITILNIALLMIILAMIRYSVIPFYRGIEYSPPIQKRVAAEEKIIEDELIPLSPADYVNIAEDNLFHPERRIPPEKKIEPELPKPDFVLYGTMVSDDLKVAYLEDLKAPRTTPGRGKRQTAVKKGDIFSGFTLLQVTPDNIVLVRGEELATVHVMDKRKTKMRESSSAADQKGPTQPPVPQPATSPKEDKPVPRAPRSAFESEVYDFFKIGTK